MDGEEAQGRAAIAALVEALNTGGTAAAEGVLADGACFMAHRASHDPGEVFPAGSLQAAMERAFRPIAVMPGDRVRFTADEITYLGRRRFLILGSRAVAHPGGADGRNVGWIIHTRGLLIAEIHAYPSAGTAISAAQPPSVRPRATALAGPDRAGQERAGDRPE